VGFVPRISANGRGLFERCEIPPLEIATVNEACRLLATLAFDAVILDSHNAELKRLSTSVRELLKFVTAVTTGEPERPPLIVLSAAGVSGELVRAYDNAGVTFLPTHQQSYRQIVAIVRDACGLTGPCCRGSNAQLLV